MLSCMLKRRNSRTRLQRRLSVNVSQRSEVCLSLLTWMTMSFDWKKSYELSTEMRERENLRKRINLFIAQ
jgi:hypothetical protein